MSKSPNIMLPALGVTGIVLGAAYGLNTRGYKAEEAALAMQQAEAAQAQIAEVQQSKEALSAEIAKVQEEAQARIAELEARPVSADMTDPAPMRDGTFGLGREALPAEIAAWDVDVLPDGRGLPVGSGNAIDGEETYIDNCASCHGDFAEGVDNWPVLSGGFGTLADEDPVKTVGSYWPYASTIFDYVHRSMPFGAAGTLSADDTYGIVAYILYSNDLIDDDFELSNETFMEVDMPNKDGFVIDDRPELEYAKWSAEPCMSNCKDEVEITMRSVFLVETPPEGGSESVMNPGTMENLPTFTSAGASHSPEPAAKPVQMASAEAKEEAAPEETGADALIADGEKVFKKCKSCHQIGAGAKNRTGPQLNGIVGANFGAVEGFKYSNALKAAAEEGGVWDEAALAAFLAKPKSYLKGTKMSFSGLKKEDDIAAVIAYLKAASE